MEKLEKNITADEIISRVTSDLDGVVSKKIWGETSLFYNPGKKLPNGVYFCTVKEKDGENDKSSDLLRCNVFRLSVGVSKETYINYFGEKPSRPVKGCVVDTGHDFTKTDRLMPHPIYAWMSWVCVLSPSTKLFAEIYPLIIEAHSNAKGKFNKNLGLTKTF